MHTFLLANFNASSVNSVAKLNGGFGFLFVLSDAYVVELVLNVNTLNAAIKEYLPGGMSDYIFKLKMHNPEPMKDLYKLLCNVEVTGQYLGDGVFLEAKRPIFRLNNKSNLN